MTYSSSIAVGRQRLHSRTPASRGASDMPRTASWGKNLNTTTHESRSVRLGPISNTVLLVIMTCLLGLLYLTQVTKTNAYGYRINALQEQQSALAAEHDQLEVASARLQAVDRVKNSAPAKALVSVAPSGSIAN